MTSAVAGFVQWEYVPETLPTSAVHGMGLAQPDGDVPRGELRTVVKS